MFGKSKLQRTFVFGLIFMVSYGFVTKEGKTYCSCWNNNRLASTGSKCNWGLDWNTGQISQASCELLCKHRSRDFLVGNVTGFSLNACRDQGAKITKPTNKAEENRYICEIWGPGNAACD